ncbi:16S rRNA (cytosine(1402)-N(4))-methyltransferase [Acetomicrobium sp.]|uniref:16S rRNA (cytosine(1402)-N(4))-methyltransferase n=1 Tax=Acetomicrobium sp. TaxID=1872099 RepID=UPI002FCB8654
MGEVKHIPVMSEEIIAILSKIDNLSYVIDATVGLGGHAFEILSSFPRVRLFRY